MTKNISKAGHFGGVDSGHDVLRMNNLVSREVPSFINVIFTFRTLKNSQEGIDFKLN